MIILCTWTSVRPNVPSIPRSGHWALVFWDNGKIFLVALIAPECIVLWSIRQWFAARRMAKEYQKYGWTITHAFFALMGGFALYDPEGNFLFHLWDQRFCHRNQGGQNGYNIQLRKLKALHPHGDGQYKSPLEYCVANKLIIITEEEIENLGHTDLLAKTIAMIQTLYFITNCIARGVSGLAITELEFFTLGFAALNLVSYSFWWHKPSGVWFPVRVMARLPRRLPSSYSQNQDVPSNGILSAIFNRLWDDYGHGEWDTWSLHNRMLWIFLLPLKALGQTATYALMTNYLTSPEDGNLFSAGNPNIGILLSITLALSAAVTLGVFHCIPIMLNYHNFPGHTQDHNLWSIFALLTTVLPLGDLIWATGVIRSRGFCESNVVLGLLM
ncbi:hypothetical protein PQX77_018385 [Marasmius sp. AFHP31]|nr:hypothetical protein PQX77_018385 [Marasmius sp. AFHP31]